MRIPLLTLGLLLAAEFNFIQTTYAYRQEKQVKPVVVLAKIDGVSRDCIPLDEANENSGDETIEADAKHKIEAMDYSSSESILFVDDGTILFNLIDNEMGKKVNQQEVTVPWSPTRWGKYDVWVYYRSDSKCRIDAVFGMLSLGANLRPSPGAPATIHLGTVYIEEKKQEAKIKLETSGEGLCKLHSLVLVPSCENEEADLTFTLGQPVILHSNASTVLGKKLRYEPKPEKNTLGFWVNPADRAFWNFEVTGDDNAIAAHYSIEILQGCGKDNGGSTVAMTLQRFTTPDAFDPASQTVEFEVKETGHWQNFEARTVGMLHLRPGKYRITVTPKQKKNAAVMDLRELRLVPREN